MPKHDSEGDALRRYEHQSLTELQGKLTQLERADDLSRGQKVCRRRLKRVIEGKTHEQQMNRLRQTQSSEWKQQKYDDGYDKGSTDRRSMKGHHGNDAEGKDDVWRQGYDDGYMWKMKKKF